MMACYSSPAIEECFDVVHAAMPQATFAGTYGDKPGYHNCRVQCSPNDYSVQQPYDLEGDGEAGSAIDITFYDPADMKAVTQRLIDESLAHGDSGKLRGLREFFGTTTGYTVTGRDVPGAYWITSDDSHLWHVHLSGKRKHATDRAAWLDIADVITGGAGTGEEDDDMPTKRYLYSASGQVTKLVTAGTWYHVKWNDDLDHTGGASMILPDTTVLFTMSAWLYTSGMGKDDNLYWRVQTLDRDSQELAKFPMGEIRATGGKTDVQFAMVGSCPKNTNLRILVSSTADNVTIEQAWWRALCW